MRVPVSSIVDFRPSFNLLVEPDNRPPFSFFVLSFFLSLMDTERDLRYHAHTKKMLKTILFFI